LHTLTVSNYLTCACDICLSQTQRWWGWTGQCVREDRGACPGCSGFVWGDNCHSGTLWSGPSKQEHNIGTDWRTVQEC